MNLCKLDCPLSVGTTDIIPCLQKYPSSTHDSNPLLKIWPPFLESQISSDNNIYKLKKFLFNSNSTLVTICKALTINSSDFQVKSICKNESVYGCTLKR